MKFLKNLSIAKPFLLAAALVSVSHAAQASSIMYNLTGVTTSAGTLTGTVTINSLTDLITAANITFNDVAVGSPVFNVNGSPVIYNGLEQDYITGASNSALNFGGQVGLYFSTANIGIGNLPVCVVSGPCGTQTNDPSSVQAYVIGNNGGPFLVTAGTLTPVAAPAPEPSSLLLLGTGVCSAAGFARRRFLKA